MPPHGLLIGQIIGRWGNFMNREAFGGPTEIFCRMGLTDPSGHTIYVHPTFLYESLWNLALLIGLLIWEKKGRRKYDGQMSLLYFFWYGLGRAWIEGLRTDSLYIGRTGIRVSQALSLVLVVCAGALLLWERRREHPAEQLFVNRAAAQTASQPSVFSIKALPSSIGILKRVVESASARALSLQITETLRTYSAGYSVSGLIIWQ